MLRARAGLGLVVLSGATALVLTGAVPTAVRAQRSAHAAAPLVFDRVTVVDVDQGKLVSDQRVVVAGNRIQAVGPADQVRVPQGAQVVDAQGKYLIPGLWDMHTHSQHLAHLFYPIFLANGVTGIRDAWSSVPLDTLHQWRREILAGTRVGPPRQLLVGAAIDETAGCNGTNSNGHICVSPFDSADGRHLVDSLKVAEADMIKMYGLSKGMYFVIAAEARRVGVPFGGHLKPGAASAVEASDSGVSIIDHMGFGSAAELDTLCGGRTASVVRCQPVAERFRRNGTWVVATLKNYFRTHGQASQRIRERRRELARFWADSSRPAGNWLRDTTGVAPADSAGYLDIAHRVGLPILAGTDAQPLSLQLDLRSFGIHAELAILAAEGLSPLEALRTATLNPAKLLRATDSLGTVASGKLADLLLLDANPLADITNTTTIRAVVANGRYYDRAALDRLLTEVQAKAKKVKQESEEP
jgi:imidazolonepropionase-like amidohydrolase